MPFTLLAKVAVTSTSLYSNQLPAEVSYSMMHHTGVHAAQNNFSNLYSHDCDAEVSS